jgi:hypothetical protein
VAANTATSSRTGSLTIGGQTFSVTQGAATCSYSISPGSASVGSTVGSGNVSVTAGTSCSWTASSGVSWITTTSTGSGSGTAAYAVAANTSTSSRSGNLTIAGQTFAITQGAALCSYTISPTSASAAASAASGTLTVTAGAGCTWTPSSSAAWLTCTPASGTGGGTVTYSVAANTTTSSRTATLTVAGQSFTLNQTAGTSCTYSISGATASFGAAGGQGSVGVTAGSGCTWTTSSSVSWITSASGGTGNGTVNYSVAANTATSSRSGTMTIAGQSFTISQTAATADNPPTASLTSPSNGATISGTTTFSGAATDDVGVTKVEFWCDGSVLLGSATTSPYSVACNTTSMANGSHTFVCKAYDSAGHSTTSAANTATVSNVVQLAGPWAKCFGGTDSDQGKAVAQDGGGNTVVVGTFRGTIDLGGGPLTSAGLSDMFIAKFTPGGVHLWSKRFGGANDDVPSSVALDANGNIFVGGSFYGTTDLGGGLLSGAGGNDMFVAKYSASGTYQWAKRLGGAGSDVVRSLAVDTSGNVIITGYFSGSPVNLGGSDLYGSGGFTVFLAKYSGADGSHIWSKNFAGGGYGDRVVIDANGDILTAGRFRGYIDCTTGWVTFPLPTTTLVGMGDDDFYLAKFQADGTHVWSKSFGSPNNDIANCLAVDSAKNIYVLGVFTGSINLGAGPMTAASIGDADLFLAKFSASGSCLWSKSIAGPYGSETAGGIGVDSTGNVTISGSFNQTLNFSAFGGPVLTSAGLGDFDIFAAKFSSAGGYVWAKRFGGVSGDYSSDLAVDGTGRAIITGSILGAGDFEDQTLTSAGSLDVLLLRLDP